MSVNLIFFSAYLDRLSWKPAGPEKKYSSLSMKVTLPNVMVVLRDGRQIPIGDQSSWIAINMPKRNGADDFKKVESLVAAVDQGAKSVLVTGGLISQWKSDLKKSEVKVSFNEVSVSRFNQPPLNHCVVQGKVIYQSANPTAIGGWVRVEDRYLNPFEQDKTKAWKSRFIEVWSPVPLPSCMGAEVLVLGNLSVHALVGQADGSVKTEPYLHVIAREFLVCPS